MFRQFTKALFSLFLILCLSANQTLFLSEQVLSPITGMHNRMDPAEVKRIKQILTRECQKTKEEIFFKRGRLSKDHPAYQYVYKIFKEALGNEADSYALEILPDWHVINAMALPDKTILISRALLDFVKYEEELKVLIAHEAFHLKREHSVNSYKLGQNKSKNILKKTLSSIGMERLQEYEADLGWLLN